MPAGDLLGQGSEKACRIDNCRREYHVYRALSCNPVQDAEKLLVSKVVVRKQVAFAHSSPLKRIAHTNGCISYMDKVLAAGRTELHPFFQSHEDDLARTWPGIVWPDHERRIDNNSW